MTLRAVVVGLVLVVVLALLTPVHDYVLGSKLLFNNSLPVPLILTVMALGLVVNPLLGARRLRVAECAIVAAMVLVLGGVVSSGLAGMWVRTVAGTPRALENKTSLQVLREPLGTARDAERQRRLNALVEAETRARDDDGDGDLDQEESRLSASAFATADADDSGTLDQAELRQVLMDDPLWSADWRWPLSPQLFLAIPQAGPISGEDPEYHRVVDGWFAPEPPEGRVRHRSQLRWRDQEGQYTGQALRGLARDEALLRDEGFLDLEDPRLEGLIGAEAGDRVQTDRGDEIEVLSVEEPGLPWAAWWPIALAWSPLLVGAIVAILTLAALVRKQWIVNERLTYPIGRIAYAFLEEPAKGQRLPSLMQNRAFWVGCAVPAVVLLWNAAYTWGLMPIPVTTSINAWDDSFRNAPFSYAPDMWWLTQMKVFFGVIAVAFFLPSEIAFSIWAIYVLSNLVIMLLALAGFQYGEPELGDAATGGTLAFSLLIVWIGRRHYLAILRAAIGRGSDPDARAAVPYLWGLLAACAVMLGFLVWHGAPWWAAVGAILLFLAMMLVLGRLVAEAGIPMLQFPHAFNHILFTTIGAPLAATALLPLALIGVSVAVDPRESLMTYAVTADYITERARARRRRRHLLLIGVALLGASLAGATMIWLGYNGAGIGDRWWAGELQRLHLGLAAERASGVAPTSPVAEMGVGAAIVGALGWARMTFPHWPLHPIGFLVCATFPLQLIWFSVFLGWLGKAGVLRYGGVALYRRLQPVAIGVIAGEALAVLVVLLVQGLARIFGAELPGVSIMP